MNELIFGLAVFSCILIGLFIISLMLNWRKQQLKMNPVKRSVIITLMLLTAWMLLLIVEFVTMTNHSG